LLLAAGGEAVVEAGEVVDVENGWDGGVVAVGVGIARGESVQEADEIVDIEARASVRSRRSWE
jgi:hypothetical protein